MSKQTPLILATIQKLECLQTLEKTLENLTSMLSEGEAPQDLTPFLKKLHQDFFEVEKMDAAIASQQKNDKPMSTSARMEKALLDEKIHELASTLLEKEKKLMFLVAQKQAELKDKMDKTKRRTKFLKAYAKN